MCEINLVGGVWRKSPWWEEFVEHVSLEPGMKD